MQRIRQIRNIKQTALAEETGIPQQTLSRYEQMETIPEKAIGKLASALKVPEEVIRDMENSDTVTFNIQNNTVENEASDSHIGENQNQGQNHTTFNPIEKVLQLSDEKAALYERLLKSSQEKIDSLKKRVEQLEQAAKKNA